MINDLDINCRLETYHIISSWCGEGPGWLIQSSDSSYINISAEQEVHMCHYLKNWGIQKED